MRVNARKPIVAPFRPIYREAGDSKAATRGDTPTHKAAEKILRKYALSFPDAVEEFPWGERVIKVRGKIFVFLGIIEDTLRIGMKLPTSFEMALTLRYVMPTGYGLGRAGWVTAKVPTRAKPDIALFKGWIDQSYRAVAPKRLVAGLGNGNAKAKI